MVRSLEGGKNINKKRLAARALAVVRSPHLPVSLIVLSSLVFTVMAIAGYRGLNDVQQLTSARNEVHDSMALAARTMLAISELEDAQRGFLLSGSNENVLLFDKAEQTFQVEYPRLILRLRQQSDLYDAARLEHIDQLVRQRISIAKFNMDLRRRLKDEGQFDLDTLMQHRRSGQRVMSALQEEFSRIAEAYATASRNYATEINSVQSRTHGLIVGLGIGGAMLIGVAVWLLTRERRLRDQAESALQELTARLERNVDDRTNELRKAMTQIQSFAKQLDKGIEAERRRLAREVHDQFGQIVTATKMMVIEMSRNNVDVPPETVCQITALLDEAISVTRRISSELRPPLLDDLGLFAAMQVYARNLSLRSKVQTVVDVNDDELLTASQSNQLFRIVQEATTNTLRHAGASRIWIRGAANEGKFQLEIVDDGRGPQGIRESATGLRNMRERASLVGGSLEFGPGPARGTAVRVVLPLQAAPAATEPIYQESL